VSRRSAVLRSAVAVLATVGVAACSGDGTGGPTVAAGSADDCPGDVVDVLVSVGQWGSLVKDLGGACATVTTIVSGAAADPHDFEPSVADIAAFSDARLVVVNGAGYDTWATNAVENLDEPPVVVNAAEVAGLQSPEDPHAGHDTTTPAEHAGDGGVDPHLWYQPDVVEQVGAAVSDWLRATSPDAAEYFAQQRTVWEGELADYEAAIAQVRSVAEGHTYAATESVFDRMAAALGLTDATPAGYRRAASNESDPAPGDLTAFERALGDGSIDVLVYNTQTSGSIPEQLRASAEDAGVPVVEVTESMPAAAGSFFAWQQAQLEALSDALAGTP
jgi:zinc/manganese transport system substrate-binding protein